MSAYSRHSAPARAVRPRRVGSIIAAAALVVAGIAVASSASAATNTLSPVSILTTSGSVGDGHTVSNLAVKDQSGTQDAWDKYVEFTPGTASYDGYRTYVLPETVASSSVTGIQVTANYRGPSAASQSWTWALWNWSTSAWTDVGSNATAPSWGNWRSLTFASPSSASSFASSAGEIRVRLVSSNASDSADLDYESLIVTSAGATDTVAPSTPTGVTVTGSTASSVTLSWTASTDDVGVTGYQITQGASTTPVLVSTGTTATVTGLSASTSYTFRVSARDAAGNSSPYSSAVTGTTTSTPALGLPTADAQFDYQIGGAYSPSPSAGVVSRDRLVPPAPGKYNVCYVNLMQTQPDESGQSPTNPPYGTTQWWKDNHFSLLLPDESTADPTDVVIDVEWDEVVFDLRTAAKREALLAIQKAWLDDCKAAGYDAIEPDNLDTYTRSINAGGTQQMSFDDNVEYLKLVIPYAHAIGLAVAQKNVNEEFADWQAATGRSGKTFVDTVSPAQGFDFAIAEECQAYEECDQYTDVYGDLIYEIEYTDNNPLQERGGVTKTAYEWACADRGAAQSIILRDRDVLPAGSAGRVYQFC